ncbi:MAG: two-component system response regulator [Desulfuromonas sp.]|nr:MAG: two-component system response regulator [Desulfuromonas sp.]
MKRVILIDDCKLTLAMARDILEPAGYEVLTAESGIEANQHIYATPPPDLIMIDVVMPMLQGDRKVKLLKDRETSAKIPVLLMSSKSLDELEVLVRESGADGYMQKPLRPQNLLQAVEQWT